MYEPPTIKEITKEEGERILAKLCPECWGGEHRQGYPVGETCHCFDDTCSCGYENHVARVCPCERHTERREMLDG